MRVFKCAYVSALMQHSTATIDWIDYPRLISMFISSSSLLGIFTFNVGSRVDDSRKLHTIFIYFLSPLNPHYPSCLVFYIYILRPHPPIFEVLHQCKAKPENSIPDWPTIQMWYDGHMKGNKSGNGSFVPQQTFHYWTLCEILYDCLREIKPY